MTIATGYPHIEQRDDGKLWLSDTQTKVIEVVLDRATPLGCRRDQRQHPHLT